MSLQQQLQAYNQQFIATVPSSVLEVLSRSTSLLQKYNLAQKALHVGDTFPKFTLPSSEGELISSAELLSQGPLIVSFYRGGWCPYCVLELKALRDIVEQLPQLNANLVAISPETSAHAASTKQRNELNFIVLSDKDNTLAAQCGLVFKMTEELKNQYVKFGVDIQAHNNNTLFELPIPATYIVDQQGVIQYEFVEEDYITRAEPKALLVVLHKL